MTTTDLDRLGDEIAELSAHLDAATAHPLELIREFDARDGWNTGFRSCPHWLCWRVGLDLGAAPERVRVARALATLPRLAQALACGELSYAKVRALTRVATPETEARLAPEVGAVLMRALDAARDTLYQQRRATDVSAETSVGPATEPPSMAQQQADALAVIVATALHHGMDPGASGERYQVVIHVDAPVLADGDAPGQLVLDGRTRVSAETSQRLACDATRVVMGHEPDGRVTEMGPRTRTVPPALRRALLHRDRGCRFPGCHVRFAEGHHIRHWAHGGPTTRSNLALLCRRHHRSVPKEGYHVERGLGDELIFRRPDGRVLPNVPTARPWGVTRSPSYGRATRRPVSTSTLGRRCRGGSASASTSCTRSTCCDRAARPR
jgi:hypothetical protein